MFIRKMKEPANSNYQVNNKLILDFLFPIKIIIFSLSFLSLIDKIGTTEYIKNSNIKLFSVCSTLLNGNNIIVYRYGILIFQTSFLSPIYQYNFTSENELNSETELVKTVISQFDFNYKEPITNDNINEKIKIEDTIIIILSTGNIYVLSPKGKFIFSDDISEKLDGDYYNLVPYKIDSVNKYYYYFIIFKNSNKLLAILYYKIDLNNKKIYYYLIILHYYIAHQIHLRKLALILLVVK